MDEPVTLARADGPRGDIVLRRRGRADAPVYELIVNGAFAMDSTETETERELARIIFEQPTSGGRVLIGGLGLGFTAAEVLQQQVTVVDVVEIEAALVDWARRGLTPELALVAADPRVRIDTADIHSVLTNAGQADHGPWDAILLDVDNGPDFLIHADNARLYTAEMLACAYARLAPSGLLAIWCQGSAPALLDLLKEISPTAAERLMEVRRGDRRFSYAIYTIRRPG
ncbi:spermidine synthase [Microlunatus panaciterrae]|uniref:Spermidine synthase n=1 Tax=Microlunatus panaciterrae TaxID=400768 RepID=A0ABS2RG89_9ACTN|nr:hypothetical protein [Microlunatus panaciterrae]MBM7797987.1 spermidine synthase [Microlunatus panaciterrae]